MAAPVRTPLLTGPAPSRALVWRRWLLGTFPGRALLIGAVVKAMTWSLRGRAGLALPPAIEAIDMVGQPRADFRVRVRAHALRVLGAAPAARGACGESSSCSYVFVGVVPVLLVITFFLLAGLLLFFNVSSYLVKSRLRSLTDQAQFLAQTTVAELQPSPTAAAFLETLERRLAAHRDPLPVRVARDRAGGRAAPARLNRPGRPVRPEPCR